MTKHEFLSALERRLSQLPAKERAQQLAYYAELIDDCMEEEGLDERSAVQRLGDVAAIADAILKEQPLPRLVRSRMTPDGGWTALHIVLLVLGSPVWLSLALALFAVLLSVYLVIWAAIAALYAAVLSIALCGLAFIAAAAWNFAHDPALALMVLGAGVACAG